SLLERRGNRRDCGRTSDRPEDAATTNPVVRIDIHVAPSGAENEWKLQLFGDAGGDDPVGIQPVRVDQVEADALMQFARTLENAPIHQLGMPPPPQSWKERVPRVVSRNRAELHPGG